MSRSFNDGVDVQFACNFRQALLCPFVLHDGSSRDDAQRADFSQVRNQLVRHAIYEEFLGRIAGQIFEGQDSNGTYRRNGRFRVRATLTRQRVLALKERKEQRMQTLFPLWGAQRGPAVESYGRPVSGGQLQASENLVSDRRTGIPGEEAFRCSAVFSGESPSTSRIRATALCRLWSKSTNVLAGQIRV